MTTRLYRSRHNRMIAGVAGGLAELWDVDPSLVRIIWALLVIATGGIALVVYIVMAVVVPDEDEAVGAWAPPTAPPPASPGAAGPSGAPLEPDSQPAAAAAAPAATAAPIAGGPQAGAGPAGWRPPGDDDPSRAAWRDARAAQGGGRRRRSNVPGTLIVGVILVALGVFFLAREFLPQLDFDLFWPLILVGIGIVLVLSAVAGPPGNRSRRP